MTTLWRDFRFGFRLLGKNKAPTAVAVLALALGIGPNTAIFSVLYATLLAPLPYPNPDQLVIIWSKVGGGRNAVSAGDFEDWRHQAKAFQSMAAWSDITANLAGPDGPEQVPGTSASVGMLHLIGIKPLLGRDFLPGEDEPGRNHVVILMNRLWQRRFGGRPDIIGHEIRINGEPYTVVGVMPPGQQDRMPNQLWTPLTFKPEQINHDFHWLLVMSRLKPGVTLKQAQADMDTVTRHIGEAYPQSNKGWSASVEPLKNDFLAPEVKTSLWLLMGGVGFVLLIACANVANLLLAQGTARQREVAVRASLGASRWQLFRQLLTESVALSLIGGLAGIGLGWATVKAVVANMPDNTLPSEANVGLNLPVLLFSLAAAMAAGVLAGCAPAWQAAQLDLNETLKQSARSLSAGRHWLRRALVMLEFALALTCLAGAGLAIHSFWNLNEVDFGVRTDHVLTFSLPVPGERFSTAEQVTGFYRQVLERLNAVPGVTQATVTTGMPLQGTYFGMPFNLAGQAVADPSSRAGAGFQMVTPGYFETFGVKLKQGRFFTEQDTAAGVRVAMVNENLARRYLKGLDPLQQRLVIEQLIPGVTKLGPGVEWQIVGVFRNVAYGDRPGDFPVIYVPFWQSPWPQAAAAVRTGGDPAAMTKSVAAAVHSIDPDLPLADVNTMDKVVDVARSGDRFATVLFGSFAAVALLLAVLGIYGVMAFVVEQRTHEIGLRMALGAGRNQVLGLVLREGLVLAAAGLFLGLFGAWLVGRAMQSLLYGIAALDMRAFGAVAAVLLASALAACYLPALRATSVDPMAALRVE
jgi:putative ABC transport system permease protein